MSVPPELRYTSDHEWVRPEGDAGDGRVRVGITDFAQDALGPVVFVQLPEVGAVLARRATLGEVESTKSVSEVYAPVGGVVEEVNGELAEKPELLNEDPYGAGWLCVIAPAEPAELDDLLDATGYEGILPA